MAACAAEPIALSNTAPAPLGEGVAFGRLRVVWNDEERQSLTSALGGNPWSVVLLPDGANAGREVEIDDDGSFAWHLPPGGYVLAGFHGWTPPALLLRSEITGRICGHFAVAGDEAHYIGTLALAFQRPAYRMSVEDNQAEMQKFAQRFPAVAMPLTKDLMILERQPRDA